MKKLETLHKKYKDLHGKTPANRWKNNLEWITKETSYVKCSDGSLARVFKGKTKKELKAINGLCSINENAFSYISKLFMCLNKK
jgi:hypothetical protein